ncbi:MAG: helix-hairpin-helix domain-containing protein, partial [Bacteroidia bacterium]|nr:helix-hairpin-helix domain-containing protein [Bacteroidia bacterium]
ELPAANEQHEHAPQLPRDDIKDVKAQQRHERFVFNPNTLSAEDAKMLGFPEKLSKTLINFRSKGGKFFKAQDLQKLYGMSPGLYAALEPYVLIPDRKRTFQRDTLYPKQSYPTKTFVKNIVEINAADSLAIVYLKGIGPGFTKRILKYRKLLGGFHSLEQLKEVYGMNDSTYAILTSQIVIDKHQITKIPINAIDLQSLRKHPYFNFQSAQAIINYRSKHGKLAEADLMGLGVIPQEKLALILPYLQY